MDFFCYKDSKINLKREKNMLIYNKERKIKKSEKKIKMKK
jgi:hypothetical protein